MEGDGTDSVEVDGDISHEGVDLGFFGDLEEHFVELVV